jgi:hypothetical protein
MARKKVTEEQVNQEVVEEVVTKVTEEEEVVVDKTKVKVKVLQTVTTGIGMLTAGTTLALELDEHTINNWTENGLIELVKG